MVDLAPILNSVKNASRILALASSEKRGDVLSDMAEIIHKKRELIKSENMKDIRIAKDSELSYAMLERLTLSDKEINSMVRAVLNIKAQEEVVGKVVGGSLRPNGMRIEKIAVPLGVVCMIYESRPNVTIDSAALCIKSGNGAILRGGKEAIHSNTILSSIVGEALEKNNMPKNAIKLITDPDRELIKVMAKAKGFIDVIIPRGGSNLINFVSENAEIPVIKHDKGVCHIYVDEYANTDMALSIAFNAKVQRPSACNAMETLLVHKDIAPKMLKQMGNMFKDVGVDMRCCPKTLEYIDARPAIDEDWGEEFHDMIVAIKIVDNIDEAIKHIEKYGSGHSEAIVTENYTNAQQFLKEVDSAVVYVNASTRFTDGGEFGLGAEIGISTQKLHVRGPMGAADLTTTKYLIYGNGQLRK